MVEHVGWCEFYHEKGHLSKKVEEKPMEFASFFSVDEICLCS